MANYGTVKLLGKDAIEAGIRVGHVNMASNTAVEVLDLNEESKESQRQHALVLQQYEAQKRARAIMVPTSIEEVKQRLRELGRPVTLFGEDASDRRERLKETIAQLELGEEELKKLQAIINQSSSSSSSAEIINQQADKTKQKEVFYSNGSDLLIQSRKRISEYTFEETHSRILKTKVIRENEEKQKIEDENTMKLYSHSKDMALNSSQVGDDRPLTCIRYSHDAKYLSTGSLGSVVKAWDVQSLSNVLVGRGHEERITSVSWNPDTSAGHYFASSSADKTCKIWSIPTSTTMDIEGGNNETAVKAIQTLHGHTSIVSSCEFHPMGKYIGTSSHDYTWRLWNVETATELLLQDGHTKDCSVISFHHDGSLVMTGDIAGLVLIWDLRSGQNIQVFQGHIKKIVSASWNSNGFQAATCSVDNQVRIWDLRKKKCGYTLPAHSNAITDVRYSKSGELLTTSSFDGSVKIFGTRDYRLINTLTGHLGKVMSCDYCPDEKHIASAGYDRTFKLWAHKNEF